MVQIVCKSVIAGGKTFDWWFVGVSKWRERRWGGVGLDRPEGYNIFHTCITEVMKQRLQHTIRYYTVFF